MDKTELIELFETFLNENGMYYSFLNFATLQGYEEDEVEKALENGR